MYYQLTVGMLYFQKVATHKKSEADQAIAFVNDQAECEIDEGSFKYSNVRVILFLSCTFT